MTTVDNLLLEITKSGLEHLDPSVPTRDKKILLSLSKQINSGNFLTENQAKLLVKILKENRQAVSKITPIDISVIDFPTWTKSFRVIEQIRKITFSKEHDLYFIVEFTYSKRLKQLISELSKVVQGQLLSINSKQYLVPLTEKNIFTVVKAFKNYGFIIDQNIMRFYEEVNEILKNKNHLFNIFRLTNDKIINAVKSDVGEISSNNICLLNDRKFKFQYTIDEKNSEKSLTNLIATRQNHKVWIDSSIHKFSDLVSSLNSLNRFPLLLVFNGHDPKECTKIINNISEICKNYNVGVYFRFDNNTDENKEFNSVVSNLKFNKNLDQSTSVAAISNNKLPKFMLKTSWYPSTVISFTNNFKNNKTSVYCDAVDLVIYYGSKQPVDGGIDAIV